MADPLFELLVENSENADTELQEPTSISTLGKYLQRLLSLRPSDLTTTEPQSLAQSSHSNVLSLQALSSRSHRSTTTSSDQLVTLQESLPTLTRTVNEVKTIVPALDDAAVTFASTYSRARIGTTNDGDNALQTRKESMLLGRQSDKLQDIIELPNLLSTAIAAAASSSAGSSNYSQALDLYAHIKRLAILYPDSQLVADVQIKADDALKEMTGNLLSSLRAQNIRLAAAIRTIGWLRRVVPELSSTTIASSETTSKKTAGIGSTMSYTRPQEEQSEGSFGALFLACRLSTFLSLTEDALTPLRDLADQETEKRLQNQTTGTLHAQPSRRPSQTPSHAVQGQQTERYLKRYIEIFREQSFSTIQMYKNIFPSTKPATDKSTPTATNEEDLLALPSALSSFPLHLVTLLMETLKTYLPNITDSAARESLLIQVLYAANSLGRLGADFSMMLSTLDLPLLEGEKQEEPEWYRVMQKHRVQAARLDAMASGQDREMRRASGEGGVAVR